MSTITINADSTINIGSTITGYCVTQEPDGTVVRRWHNNTLPTRDLGDTVAMPQSRYSLSSEAGLADFAADFLAAWGAAAPLIITYSTGVYTQVGWRQVTVRAEAERVSPAMARVLRVLALDGEEPHGTLSRTGARRQQYYATAVAKREVGSRKRLSACAIESRAG